MKCHRTQACSGKPGLLLLGTALALTIHGPIAAQPNFTFQSVQFPAPLNQYRATAGDNHGPGATFTDLDNDGYPDLVLVSGPQRPSYVYRNKDNGSGGRTFEQAQVFPAQTYGSTGAIAGDYDNDGDLDIYILNHPFHNLSIVNYGFPVLDFAPNELWQNQLMETGNLTFVNVTASTDPTPGVADRQFGLSHAEFQGVQLDNSLTAGWADVDRDGDLDLFVGNHDGTVAGPHENMIPGQRDILYQNNGDGTFTDVTMEFNATGFEDPNGNPCSHHQCYSSSNAATFADINNDGWPDLMVTNKANNHNYDADMLYINLGQDGAGRWRGFENQTYQMTAPFFRASENAMGIDTGDWDNDGDLDIYITDLECRFEGGCDGTIPPNEFFVNQLVGGGSLDFVDATDQEGVGGYFSWGAQWLDVDNDGRLDLHVTTGPSFEDILYMQENGSLIDRAAVLQVDQQTRGKSNFASDWNRDGAIDLFVINTNDPTVQTPNGDAPKLYENQLVAGGANTRFLNLTLKSHPRLNPIGNRKASRDAIGTRVRVTAAIDGGGNVNQIREVVSGNGNAASTASLDLEFGLRQASTANVRVEWPSGRVTNLNNVAANQFLTVSEPGFSAPTVIGESGSINASSSSKTINFSRSYTNPVLFVQPPTFNGGHVSVARITDVRSNGADFFIHEAPNHDGPHTVETLSWIVLEAGSWQLADGTRLEVGKTNVTANVGSSISPRTFATINFPSALGNGTLMPMVLTQVQTNLDPAWVKTRQRFATANSFQVALEPADSVSAVHGLESVGWLAMEPSRGTWNNRSYAAGTTRDAVTHNWYRVDFGQGLGNAPRLLASLATYDGSDGSGLRYQNLGAGSVEIKVEEDTSKDAEVNHTTERVSFLALSGNGTLNARAYVADPPPTVNFTSSCNGRTCTFTQTASDNQTIPSYGYSWQLGDGAHGDGPSVTHTYATGGTKTVKLLVTDRGGQTRSQNRLVPVSGGSQPPVPNFTVSCTGLVCNFNASSSTDDTGLPANGYSWDWNDGTTGSGRITSHTFERPGTIDVQLTVTDDHGQSRSISKEVTTTLKVELIATYKQNISDVNRTTFASESLGPVPFNFSFDPNLGKYGERPFANCQRGRPENPTYLKISLRTTPATQQMDGCEFQGSWDDEAYQCSQPILDGLNAGTEFIINTDDLLMDEGDCTDTSTPQVGYNQLHEMRVTFRLNEIPYHRAVKFRNQVQVFHRTATDDTYVDEANPTLRPFNSSVVSMKPGPGTARFGFWKFQMPAFSGTLASAQFQARVTDGSTGDLELHHVCLDGWTENQLDWTNWGTLTGSTCGVVNTASGLSANTYYRFDVTSAITGAGAHSLGGLLGPVGSADTLGIASTESAPSIPKPKIVVSVQH